MLINFKYFLSSFHFASIISFKSNLNLRQTWSLIWIIPNSSFSPHNLDQLITFYVTLACTAQTCSLFSRISIHQFASLIRNLSFRLKRLISKNRTGIKATTRIKFAKAIYQKHCTGTRLIMYFHRSLRKSLHLDRDPWNDVTPRLKLVDRFLTNRLDRSARRELSLSSFLNAPPTFFYPLELASSTPHMSGGKKSAYPFHTGRFIRPVFE